MLNRLCTIAMQLMLWGPTLACAWLMWKTRG